MSVVEQIKSVAKEALGSLYPDAEIPASAVTVNQTKPEFEGDYTLVLFPFLKILRQKPDAIGTAIGDYLKEHTDYVTNYSIVAGFLNLTISDKYWATFLQDNFVNTNYGKQSSTGKNVMVEYSSPNTNKPLHFGHLRNIFLGYAMSSVLEVTGNNVIKANLINDRGIHICKSMLAWQRYANGATPESTGIKGDHLVGDYYVRFNNELKKELAPYLFSIFNDGQVPDMLSEQDGEKVKEHLSKITTLSETEGKVKLEINFDAISKLGNAAKKYTQEAVTGNRNWKDVLKCFSEDEYKELDNVELDKKKDKLKSLLKSLFSLEEKINDEKSAITEIITRYCSLTKDAAEMLRKWEAGDEEIVSLWETMNGWVYDGFDVSYKRMGVDFNKMYYESDTYLLGKEVVQEGLDKNVFLQKEDGSIWIDLQDEGLDQKILQRKDGTSVYITQDIGTAIKKYEDCDLDTSIYVIGDEQNYHMQVLKLILQKLKHPCADGIYHLSYGMVELPTGKMKSREGTVVDADDMMDEMIAIAKQQTEEAGKTDGFSQEELDTLYETIGLGALKFYLLRVDPKKKMIFDPKESIDLHGFTATFIQYAHARICSILRKENVEQLPAADSFSNFKLATDLTDAEKKLIVTLEQYPEVMQNAADDYNPSLLCNYTFQLAQQFNSFYDAHSISKAENEEKKQLRLMIIVMTAQVMRHAMGTLGIRLPNKM